MAGAVISSTRLPPAAPPPPRIPMPQRTRGAVPWNARAGGGGTGLRLQPAPAGVADPGFRAGLGRWPGRPRTGLPLDAPQPRIGVGTACRRPRQGGGFEWVTELFSSTCTVPELCFEGCTGRAGGRPRTRKARRPAPSGPLDGSEPRGGPPARIGPAGGARPDGGWGAQSSSFGGTRRHPAPPRGTGSPTRQHPAEPRGPAPVARSPGGTLRHPAGRFRSRPKQRPRGTRRHPAAPRGTPRHLMAPGAATLLDLAAPPGPTLTI